MLQDVYLLRNTLHIVFVFGHGLTHVDMFHVFLSLCGSFMKRGLHILILYKSINDAY